MDLRHPLGVITPTVDGDVLAALAGADAAFTGRQVHRLVGRYSEAGVRNVLNRLVDQGVVLVHQVGPSYTYRLNRDHLAAPHIVALAGLYREFLDRLRSRLAQWDPPPVYAALFGSAVRGDMRLDSDIDLFVVRPDDVDMEDDQWWSQLSSLTSDMTRWTGNDARPLECTHEIVRRGMRRGEPVFQAILNEGVHLTGPSDYLRTIKPQARTRAARRGRL
jgi:hypothetical protein